MKIDIKNYWAGVKSSSHRGNDSCFYISNANEHIGIIGPDDGANEVIDLGCGAGKLLEHYIDNINIRVGLDFSDNMLADAFLTTGGRVELLNADVFEYLPRCKMPIWITTGALNQYLVDEQLKKLVSIFKSNENAKSFYLFETICPLRYDMMMMGLGLSFRFEHLNPSGKFRHLKDFVGRCKYAFNFVRGKYSKNMVYLGSSERGYAYPPSFWLLLGHDMDLSVEIIGSKYYEYRYHVILKKN